ncbi:MAG TPA: Asp-tRNA(Asn)/Glu-tRNA(Gln) amidotransferase subunit GatC [Hellea balneolensis]|uniref:Aspartyl/glutamyl-tRNA(Asn/Gln) amidotransferase subunit C n=1 Tax=Hellea balneolensis TaxID=287478 RepID=A0A7V5NWP3_9PROT|nr:Asp-tRNA(Asn)/Glu-tRNA(Gln) amidotransferase subunit GatC [Hellea balneolensis]
MRDTHLPCKPHTDNWSFYPVKRSLRVSEEKNGVTADTVRNIARLSRLHVEPDRLAPLADEMNGILAWIEQLDEVDVEGVAPMTSAVEMEAPMRDDIVDDGNIRDKILANAPKTEAGYFVVPRSVE